MSHSYRDTQGGGHIDPPQVVNCPNHPRLDRVNPLHWNFRLRFYFFIFFLLLFFFL